MPVKSLETLLEKAGSVYPDKVGAVTSSWAEVAKLPGPAVDSDNAGSLKLVQHLHRLTLELLLRGEWAELPMERRSELLAAVSAAGSAVQLPAVQAVCSQVQTLADGPWQQPILKQLMAKETVTDEQALELCCTEQPDLLTLRLQTLCESRCEDLALALVRLCHRCRNMADGMFNKMCSDGHKLLFLDLYIALLFKYKEKDVIITLLSDLDGAASVGLVRRFVARRHECRQRMWRQAARVAAFLAQLVLVQALLRPDDQHVCDLTVEWAKLAREEASTAGDVEPIARRIFSRTELACHLISFARGLSQVDSEEKASDVLCPQRGHPPPYQACTAALPSYQAAIASLQYQAGIAPPPYKTVSAPPQYHVGTVTPPHYTCDSSHLPIASQLTSANCEQASSHNSTEQTHGRLGVSTEENSEEKTAQRINQHADLPVEHQQVQPRVQPPDKPPDLVAEGHPPGSPTERAESQSYDVLADCGPALDALGVSEQLAADLVVVLSSTRWKRLSWALGWRRLRALCRAYLADPACMMNITRDLRFLEIDYSKFGVRGKSEPVDEFHGIEKGYERFLKGGGGGRAVGTAVKCPTRATGDGKSPRKAPLKVEKVTPTQDVKPALPLANGVPRPPLPVPVPAVGTPVSATPTKAAVRPPLRPPPEGKRVTACGRSPRPGGTGGVRRGLEMLRRKLQAERGSLTGCAPRSAPQPRPPTGPAAGAEAARGVPLAGRPPPQFPGKLEPAADCPLDMTMSSVMAAERAPDAARLDTLAARQQAAAIAAARRAALAALASAPRRAPGIKSAIKAAWPPLHTPIGVAAGGGGGSGVALSDRLHRPTTECMSPLAGLASLTSGLELGHGSGDSSGGWTMLDRLSVVTNAPINLTDADSKWLGALVAETGGGARTATPARSRPKGSPGRARSGSGGTPPQNGRRKSGGQSKDMLMSPPDRPLSVQTPDGTRQQSPAAGQRHQSPSLPSPLGQSPALSTPSGPRLAEQLREFESVLEAVVTGQDRPDPPPPRQPPPTPARAAPPPPPPPEAIEEDDQTRNRIVAILQQYRRDLAAQPRAPPAAGRARTAQPAGGGWQAGSGAGGGQPTSLHVVSVPAPAGGAAGGGWGQQQQQSGWAGQQPAAPMAGWQPPPAGRTAAVLPGPSAPAPTGHSGPAQPQATGGGWIRAGGPTLQLAGIPWHLQQRPDLSQHAAVDGTTLHTAASLGEPPLSAGISWSSDSDRGLPDSPANGPGLSTGAPPTGRGSLALLTARPARAARLADLKRRRRRILRDKRKAERDQTQSSGHGCGESVNGPVCSWPVSWAVISGGGVLICRYPRLEQLGIFKQKMETRILRCPLVCAVLLLSGNAAGQQCTPLVLCPAILRDPASHLVGTRAACPLADGSNGVLCPTDVIDRSPGHGGYDYRYRPMPQQSRVRSQIPLPRRLTRPEEVILKMLYPDVVQRLLNTADFLLRSREQRAAQLTAQGTPNRFRTHDGTCNNQQRPRQGSAHTVYERFFPSDYADGLHAPRARGANGRELPSPRLVSSRVGESNTADSLDVFRTIGLTLFGQFVDHDLTATPEFALENTSIDEAGEGGGFSCCNRDHSFPAMSLHPLACIPIRIPADDPVFGPAGRPMHEPDHRVGENIGLAYEHLVWTREHNRVAAALAVRHPDYDDERLYQEARRIVIGEYQHIVFNEWLPTILGYGYTQAAGLAPGSSPGYSPEARGVIANEFSTAAFRFAHSMVHDVFELESQAIALERTFFNSSFLLQFGLVREVARSLTTQRPGWVDRAFSSALRERLFIRPGMPGLDLVALNINRGREHGLQPYITAVENCQGRTIASWEDLADLMEPETIARLRGVYDSVEDVDLFIGVVSERRARNAAVGRTLQCLIGQQFIDLRDGDRFFYEHTGLPNSFTPAQLAELRRASLARVYCDNVQGLDHIQPLAFFQPQFFSNGRQSCETLAIPTPDLSVF
ncbi:Peroxidasin [Amphibalanus amphitrite]|uniref:Peroxidasin n=1 Tax=Amphibalanus amphitrite TaxID=1232801 RepID=A0A6A4V1L0_AMPAM|nr:Peroxidasin [Amphibalanus amphitrite]